MLLSLVLLTVITLTAVIGMQRSTLQIKMLNNMQHHQEVFNATNDHVESAVTYLQGNIDSTRELLGPIIQTDNTSNQISNAYLGDNWVKPTGYANHISVTDTIRLSDISEPALASPSYLKSNPGSSAGTTQKYYFDYIATGSNSSGRITSTQEIVFHLEGPAI